jgi:hypothetical protein
VAGQAVKARAGPGANYSRQDFWQDFAMSLLYTALIVVLIKFKIIQPISNYMPAK